MKRPLRHRQEEKIFNDGSRGKTRNGRFATRLAAFLQIRSSFSCDDRSHRLMRDPTHLPFRVFPRLPWTKILMSWAVSAGSSTIDRRSKKLSTEGADHTEKMRRRKREWESKRVWRIREIEPHFVFSVFPFPCVRWLRWLEGIVECRGFRARAYGRERRVLSTERTESHGRIQARRTSWLNTCRSGPLAPAFASPGRGEGGRLPVSPGDGCPVRPARIQCTSPTGRVPAAADGRVRGRCSIVQFEVSILLLFLAGHDGHDPVLTCTLTRHSISDELRSISNASRSDCLTSVIDVYLACHIKKRPA